MYCKSRNRIRTSPYTRITSAGASSGRRRGGEDQRTPLRAGGRRRNATVSLYHLPAVYPFISTHARMHACTSRATVAVLCICLCVYGGESLMRQASTVRTCIGNGTSRIDYRSKKYQEVRMPRCLFERIFPYCIIQDFFRFLLVNYCEPLLGKIHITLSYLNSKPIINSCKSTI